jgi:hypothetical protein
MSKHSLPKDRHSMSELGKSAKRMGHQHPSVARRIDPVPARATPKAKPKRKHEKPYGYAWRWAGLLGLTDKTDRHHWFKTVQQRDQALHDAQKKAVGHTWIKIIGPVDRQPLPGVGGQ